MKRSVAISLCAVLIVVSMFSVSGCNAKKNMLINERKEAVTKNELPIGGWSTPASALRDGYTETEGSYDRAMQLVADAGMNFVITLEEWSSGSWPLETLSSAKKAGLKVWYNCCGMAADYSVGKINDMLASADADALEAVYIKDEPAYDDIEDLANTSSAVKSNFSGSSLKFLSNLLPIYAPASSVTIDYRSYVNKYISYCKPDILMFDYYPYTGTGDSSDDMLVNLGICKEEADSADIPLYSFIQLSGSEGGLREPTLSELMKDINLNLAFGVKGIAYFLCCEHYENWGYSTIIDYSGNKTELYETVQAANEKINAMEGVYLNYNCKGVMVASIPTLVDKVKYSTNSYLASFDVVTSAECTGSGAIIGCFEGIDDSSEKGVYAVNYSTTETETVTLTLSEDTTCYIWTSSGLSDVQQGNSIKIKLAAGEGAFVEIVK